MTARTTLVTCAYAAMLSTVPVGGTAMSAEGKENVVSGVLMKLDLSNGRGLLTTDLGRPIYFEVPKAYLFENVTVGAHISLGLDEDGRAIKVMDTSLPDLIVPPNVQERTQPIASQEEPQPQ